MYLKNVLWPAESGEYKVIQILEPKEQEPFLRFGEKPKERWMSQWHSDIVKKFAEEIGVQCEERTSCVRDDMIPILPKSTTYQIVGMGKCHVSLESEIASFHGESEDYGMKINREHLDLMRGFSVKKLFIEVGE